MADRIDDNADLAVAELRRKARRRLVGAIVLALAAAILLPLLLEKEPRSLGDEVSIQIPPVDNGKFVTRLTPEKAKGAAPDTKATPKSEEAPKTEAVPKTAPPKPTEAVKTEEAPAPASAAATKGASVEPATRAITPAPPAVADAGAKPESAPEPSPTPAAAPPSAPAAESAAPAAASTDAGKHEGFIIQLAAFTDDKGANSFANRIRKLGYPAYVEPIEKSTGKMWRVRVGGYATRAAAYDDLAKLKAEGHNGLVSAAK